MNGERGGKGNLEKNERKVNDGSKEGKGEGVGPPPLPPLSVWGRFVTGEKGGAGGPTVRLSPYRDINVFNNMDTLLFLLMYL